MAAQTPWKSTRTRSAWLSPRSMTALAVSLLVVSVVTFTLGRPGLEPLAAVHVPVDVLAASDQASDMQAEVAYSFESDHGLAAPASPAEPREIEPAEPVVVEPAGVEDPASPATPVARRESAPQGPTFNGRPIRKSHTVRMLVTAYSPDARSCGKWADGITASGYSVWTNGMKLVAADTRLLPFGSIISVPGYNGGNPVPVLDRGGAIKGRRLDVLYPTHEIARQWGAQRLTVTVWEYAD